MTEDATPPSTLTPIFTEVPGASRSPVDPVSTPHSPEELSWGKLAVVTMLCVLIAVTVVGNTLIIAAVLTTRRLRTVTNCFVMSLAVADWLVGIFVMPPKVALHLMGRWELGVVLCNIWISLDILLCTASILSLCAISVDRYLAVTQPLNYSRRRRSKRLALLMILVVWLTALAITCPPLFFFKNDTEQTQDDQCAYNDNKGYVIFSAMGSFFIPLTVMLYVYARISCVIAQRHNQLTSLDGAPQRSSHLVNNAEESDMDRGSSDCEEAHMSVRCPGHGMLEFPANHHRSMRAHYSYCPAVCNDIQHSTRSSMYGRTSRPESLALDVASVDGNFSIALPLEGTSRVSSFRRESKTAQTLSIVVGGFVACWLPFFIIYILTPFVDVPDLVMSILVWLGWINSAINPFIYAFYSPDFRIAFWRLTFRQCSGPRRPTDPSLRHK
ncbi:probable G-protein coupled receptor No18 [Anabrus simplex]|uniref:probable G-protein coupled receptor No18 n=1 Tax=Anabrus simplex TaxID=316456 RepID=UPI0034DD7180